MWARCLVSIVIAAREDAAIDVSVNARVDRRYPRRGALAFRSAVPLARERIRRDELLAWCASLDLERQALALTNQRSNYDPLVHVRLAPRGDTELRAVVFALPWQSLFDAAVISFARGTAPAMPRLTIPVEVSGPADVVSNVSELLRVGELGHIVVIDGDDVPLRTRRSTRLLVWTHGRLATPPPGPFNVLQLAGAVDDTRSYVREVLRAVSRDEPLDAAIRHVPSANVRLDLFDEHEHCLRPRQLVDETSAFVNHVLPPKSSFKSRASKALQDIAELLDGARPLEVVGDGLRRVSDTLDEAEARAATARDVALDRSAQLWLARDGRVLPARTALVVDTPYDVQFQVASQIRSGATVASLDDEALREQLVLDGQVELTVILYVDRTKVTLGVPDGILAPVYVRRWGASNIVGTTLTAKHAGVHQLRACVFHKGNLVQSLVVELGVGEAGEPPHVDYTGIDTFASIQSLPEVACTVWINETGGRHWIGVYDREHALALPPAPLARPSFSDVSTSVPPVRTALAVLQGVGGNVSRYRFARGLPVGPERNDGYLVELARHGRRMFTNLLQQRDTTEQAPIASLAQQLRTPDRIISIARLDDNSSVPWSLMYDHRIDTADGDLSLCTRYRLPHADATFAESPEACRAQDECPLKDVDAARATVCPFGFWGFRHQIELRVRSTSASNTPVDRTRVEAGERPRTAAAMYAFAESPSHLAELGRFLATDALRDRREVLRALRQGQHPLYYFFCHAEPRDGIRLKLAADQFIEPSSIAARYEAAEDGWDITSWDEKRPLVFLNACQSIALHTQLISPFLDKFFGLGASAVVGTEVSVFTELAAEFATELLRRLTAGEPLGMALLRVRRRMLGRGNPLGLAYSVYGSAALHFHAAAGCRGCAPQR